MNLATPKRSVGSLKAARFRVSEPTSLAEFYCSVLGMAASPLRGSPGGCSLSFGPGQMRLDFMPLTTPLEPPEAEGQGLYWKIAISVSHLDLAVDRLRSRGVEVSDPRQFEDVGYLSHFRDPEGLEIELIQHVFEARELSLEDEALDRSLGSPPLGPQASLNLLTLRTQNLEAHRQFYVEKLGLALVSVQPVQKYGFTLYFFSAEAVLPPHEDLTDIGNRTWLYQQPNAFLELQVRNEPRPLEPGSGAGFQGLTFGRGEFPGAQSPHDPDALRDPDGWVVCLE